METNTKRENMTVQNLTVETRVDQGEFQTEQVLTISSAHFVHDVYSAFLAPLLPLVIEKMSLTLTLAGWLSAFMQLPAILTPFIGHLADKYNLRFLVIIAPALTATAMSAMGLASNYGTLALLLTMAGISSAIFHAPAPAMVGQVSGKRTGKGMSWFMGGGELARTVGPIVAVWVVSSWALEGMFRVVVIGWAASAILFWRFRDVPISARRNGSMQSIIPKLRILFVPLFFILFSRMFMLVCMTTYLPTYMNLNGASLLLSGASLSILELAGFAGALSGGTISDRLGRKPLLMGITILSPLLMITFVNVSGWLLVPVLLSYGFVSISAGPVFLALIQDNFPENRAVSNGLYISMNFLLRSLVMILVGIAGDAIGLPTAFLGSAVFSLFGMFGIFMLPDENG
jgi:FSR family fosmidomycin resistance protein-like MFS transporter